MGTPLPVGAAQVRAAAHEKGPVVGKEVHNRCYIL